MDLLDLAQLIFNSIETLAIVISLVYVAIQVRENTKITKSANYQAVVNIMSDFEARLNQDEETISIFQRGSKDRNVLKKYENHIFAYLLARYFMLFELMHYQHRKNLLDTELWQGWKTTMLRELGKPGIQQWWHVNKKIYNVEFVKFIESNTNMSRAASSSSRPGGNGRNGGNDQVASLSEKPDSNKEPITQRLVENDELLLQQLLART